MHNHTLGWTSDNGCNVFALGWLSLLTITYEAGGGLDSQPIAKRKGVNSDESDLKDLLVMFLSLTEMED